MADFDYGNTRLRARLGRRLTAADYDALVQRDVEGVLSALADTPYGPHLDEAAALHTGAEALVRGVHRHAQQQLSDLGGFYQPPLREAVLALLQPFEVDVVVDLVRGIGAAVAPELLLEGLRPVGRFTPAVLEACASCSDVAALVDLLVGWSLPSRPLALALVEALPDWRETRRSEPLEHALVQAWGRSLVRADLPELVVQGALARLHDRVLMALLRLRAARDQAEGLAPDAVEALRVPGVPDEWLDAVWRADDRTEAARRAAAGPGAARWGDALDVFAQRGDLLTLERDLAASRLRWAMAVGRADPLGLGVAVGFVHAVDAEVRNLRIVGLGRAAGLEPDALRPLLLEAR